MAKAKKSTEGTEPVTPTEGAEEKKAAPKKKAAAAAKSGGTASAADTGAAEKKPAEKKPAAKKPAAAKPATATPAGGFGGFGIDTDLAAQAAAKMLLNRSAGQSQQSSEGSTVKYLKETMNKPQSGGAGNLLGGGPAGGGKASNLPHFKNQQKGHNQATGHVGNTGVPRRTPG